MAFTLDPLGNAKALLRNEEYRRDELPDNVVSKTVTNPDGPPPGNDGWNAFDVVGIYPTALPPIYVRPRESTAIAFGDQPYTAPPPVLEPTFRQVAYASVSPVGLSTATMKSGTAGEHVW
jgi:hypothetical protein